jgi:hypothetical protein
MEISIQRFRISESKQGNGVEEVIFIGDALVSFGSSR